MASLKPGLYRAVVPHPRNPTLLPAPSLIYVGRREEALFAVRPFRNQNNRWFWQEPVEPVTESDLASDGWAHTLLPLPPEGFYVLPKTMKWDGGGQWLENAIVQLGYNIQGGPILFVAEHRQNAEDNALYFSETGQPINDELLRALRWAPILPVGTGRPAVQTLH